MSDTPRTVCRLCGAVGFGPSYGGPNICPSCDCGIPPESARLKRDLAAANERIKALEADAIAIRQLINVSGAIDAAKARKP